MSSLLQELSELSPQELEAVRRRLNERGRKKPALEQEPSIARRDSGDPLDLAPAQLRVWLLDQLDPGGGGFHLASGLRLRGPLQEEALRQSFSLVTQRHDALRLSFFETGGRPSMKVREQAPAPLEVHSLEDVALEERLDRALEQARQEALRPFDLERGPLLRGALYRLGPEDHLLAIFTHHIVVDHASMFLLGRELEGLYEALLSGGALPPAPSTRFADWVLWQAGRTEAGALEPSLEYWRAQLEGAPEVLRLPLDRPRGTAAYRQAFVPFAIEEAVASKLEERARTARTTLFGVMLAGLGAALGRITGSPEAAVGAVLAGRMRRELDTVLGLFFNPVVLRLRELQEGEADLQLAHAAKALLEAQEHQAVPFERLVEELRPPRLEGRTPFFQVALNLQDRGSGSLTFAGLPMEPVEILRGPANLDLYLSVEEVGERIAGVLEYDAALFDEETVAEIRDVFLHSLEILASGSPSLGAALPVGERLQSHLRALEQRCCFTVAANFTADLLEEPLRFWLSRLGIEGSIEMAPYQQVFQELLTPTSRFRSNRKGANLLLLRLEDWLRFDGGEKAPGDAAPFSVEALRRLEKTAEDFLEALRSGLEASSVPCIVCLAAPSPDWLASSSRRELQKRWVESLRQLSSEVPSLHLLESADLETLYPVPRIHDDLTLHQGHIPFTEEYFTAAATMVARTIHGLQRAPLKVIVLDCDNTLWGGVAAEDGAEGVELSAAHLALQRFMVAQKKAGRILCLCSKNEEKDVWTIFDGRGDMVLQRQDLVAWRINWKKKSDNLVALADELSLGLDSFAFVDDNPVECAEVQAACPQVLVVPLPAEAEQIPRFLEHIWAFDTAGSTAEDARRTELYQQNAQRREAQSQAASLGDFLEKLELEVEIRPPAPGDLPRLAQLTQRTNQFNARPQPRSEEEVRECLETGDGRIVAVRDRFGDYGLVGVLLWRRRQEALEVDTFLLSCRVLGRYVEHRMLVHLGEEARRQGVEALRILLQRTERNRPVRDFLDSALGAATASGDPARTSYDVSSIKAVEMPCEPGPEEERQEASSSHQPASSQASAPRQADAKLLKAIASQLYRVEAIRAEVLESRRQTRQGPRPAFVPPEGPIEEAVAEIWQELLSVDSVGSQDNFFALGGHSLLGTVLLSRIRDAFDLSLDLGDLFRAPTLNRLCSLLEDRLIATLEAEELESSLESVMTLSESEARARAKEESFV